MKIWIATNTVKQPTHTVSGRYGASVMFVGYERLLNQWYWLQPRGVREKIDGLKVTGRNAPHT